ncbi:MAG: transglutaminase family protein [Pseudomonadota bacterium]
MIYTVTHTTSYSYQNPAAFSQHLMRLSPRAHAGQQVHSAAIAITPEPDSMRPHRDMFGNLSHVATVTRPHSTIDITATCRVERSAPSAMIFEASSPWEDVRDAALGRSTRPVPVEISPFAFPSSMTQADQAIAEYVRASFPEGRPVLAGALEMTARIYEDFTYLPGATGSDTLPVESFATRRGVCQDFAHVMLAGLRALRIPARYVSGYLRTIPPEGQAQLAGADASHAWVALWDPVFGWVDFDPTNNMVPGLDHISLAWARDYADVAPVSGIVIGAGQQILSVAVDVSPATPQGARSGLLRTGGSSSAGASGQSQSQGQD